jgi:hypothetical protein
MMPEAFNETLWVLSNVLVGYVAFALLVFAIAYPILFDPRATTAGRVVLRFIGSLVGVVGLSVVAVFIDPQVVPWWEIPPGLEWWRAPLRLIVFLYVAYSVTALVGVLVVRKFRPGKIQTAPEDSLPLIVRPNRKKNR